MTATDATARPRRDDDGPDVTPTRRAPRQARSAVTRRRLLDAGFEAFAAKGFEGVNLVEDVLEPAGISIGSFYHQFADKAELLREILAEAADKRRAFIVRLGELQTVDDLSVMVRLVIERLYDSLEHDEAAWRLQRVARIAGADGLHDGAMNPRDIWNAALAQVLGGWFDRPPTDLRRASDLVVTLARGFVSDFLDTPAGHRRQHRIDHVDEMVLFVIGGLTATLGQPRTVPSASS